MRTAWAIWTWSSRRRGIGSCLPKLPQAAGPIPQLADDALVAIGFTSGTTGSPQPNPKTWGSF